MFRKNPVCSAPQCTMPPHQVQNYMVRTSLSLVILAMVRDPTVPAKEQEEEEVLEEACPAQVKRRRASVSAVPC